MSAEKQVRGVRQEKRAPTQAPLTGLLYDSSGGGMTPTHTVSRGRQYRYYVATDLQQGGRKGRADADQIRRVPAEAIEGLVLDRLRALSDRDTAGWDHLRPFLKRVEIRADVVVMHIEPPSHSRWDRRGSPPDSIEAGEGGALRLVIPMRLKLRGGRTWLLGGGERAAVDRPRRDRSLIAGLRRAHVKLAKHGMRTTSVRPDWSGATGVDDFYLRKMLRLGFLAPDIQLAILDGRQPPGLTLGQMLSAEIPLAWADQRAELGFPVRP